MKQSKNKQGSETNGNHDSIPNQNLVKINLSLNYEQISDIDEVSKQTKSSRSGFIRHVIDLFFNENYDDDYLLVYRSTMLGILKKKRYE